MCSACGQAIGGTDCYECLGVFICTNCATTDTIESVMAPFLKEFLDEEGNLKPGMGRLN